VRLADTTSLDEALERIAARAQTLPADDWLQGSGWNHAAWNSHWPTRHDLDRVCGERPAVLERKDGHSVWASSAALARAGIDHTTPDPPGGHIQRDTEGIPTGILLEAAQHMVLNAVGEPTPAERLNVTQDAILEALSYGLTGLHIPPGPDANDAPETLNDLRVLYGRGALPVRCLVHLAARDLDAALALGLRSGLGDEWLRIGGLKIFADGSLGSETAEMLLPYEDRRDKGMAMLEEAELHALVQRANQAGISVIIHAIGDAANRKVLNAIEQARAPNAAPAEPLHLPNRIEHAQLVHPADVPRFAALEVLASMQPLHATSDMPMADELWGRRCATAYALRTLQEAGATLALGSDAPIDALNPWLGIHAAVTRQRTDNTPTDGWYPEQRLSLTDALRGYTRGPAIASGEAAVKGTLEPGMLADLAVLNVDPFMLPPEELHTVQADMTLVGGEVRWERKSAT
jgi:hypothetical protein